MTDSPQKKKTLKYGDLSPRYSSGYQRNADWGVVIRNSRIRAITLYSPYSTVAPLIPKLPHEAAMISGATQSTLVCHKYSGVLFDSRPISSSLELIHATALLFELTVTTAVSCGLWAQHAQGSSQALVFAIHRHGTYHQPDSHTSRRAIRGND